MPPKPAGLGPDDANFALRREIEELPVLGLLPVRLYTSAGRVFAVEECKRLNALGTGAEVAHKK